MKLPDFDIWADALNKGYSNIRYYEMVGDVAAALKQAFDQGRALGQQGHYDQGIKKMITNVNEAYQQGRKEGYEDGRISGLKEANGHYTLAREYVLNTLDKLNE
jgi:flagellar biosynthesis/type III secretory pathway protein FliH